MRRHIAGENAGSKPSLTPWLVRHAGWLLTRVEPKKLEFSGEVISTSVARVTQIMLLVRIDVYAAEVGASMGASHLGWNGRRV